MESPKYTIEELCDLTGFSRRTIRYYVQSGIIDAPAGRGRGGFYFDSHVDKLRQIRSFQEQGLSLQTIQSRLVEDKSSEITSRQGVWVRYDVAPGVEIHINREREKADGRRIVELIRTARAIMKEEESS